MSKMTNIHVKLDYAEALESKKDLLVSEKSLLELIRHLKSYNALRKKTYTLKNKLPQPAIPAFWMKFNDYIKEIYPNVSKHQDRSTEDRYWTGFILREV